MLSVRLVMVNRKLQTERRKLESESRLRHALLNTMQEGVYGVDHQGKCAIINPAALEMLGYSEAQLLGHNPHPLFHHHDADGVPYPERNCPVMQTLLDGKPRNCEDWFIRKNGEGFPAALTITPNVNIAKDENPVCVVVVFHDISESRKEAQRVLHLAQHDALTNLPNRALFEDRMDQALSLAKRDGVFVALMFVDLDKFKPINDTFGHQVGDLLLIEVARRLEVCLRDSDTAARIGGDEFVVLLPCIKVTEDAKIVAEKILCAIREPFHLGEATVDISASIGIAVDLLHECDQKKLKNRADVAMYRAKEKGRNNVTLYQTEWNEHLNWSI
jgi:diguanylate cyclase (GGDEF)-like protein/PAS domain S-box-containing protein